jgi:hypothetical protein
MNAVTGVQLLDQDMPDLIAGSSRERTDEAFLRVL